GGVGLNLQSASMVVNLDIPWNPAVLEQRIARVHRLGQKTKVQVVNLVSTGTIEHKMLDVLAFKSGLAEGILDDGEDSIFMADSKFKKFMESVEDLTAVPEPSEEETEEPVAAAVIDRDEIEEKLPDDAPKPLPKEDDWKDEGEKEPALVGGGNRDYQSGPRRKRIGEIVPPTPEPAIVEAGSPQALVQMGMNFFSGLTQTLADPVATQNLVKSITETDEKTGQSYLKIPVQSTEIVTNAFKMISALFQQK
ncbi:MAG: helicase-related protein, partial [Saprospiraceae bacterium]